MKPVDGRKTSRLQQIIEGALRVWFPGQEIIVNHRPPWLGGLELDLHLPELGFAVEVNGYQHMYWLPKFMGRLENFETLAENDVEKSNICKSHEVKLYRVICQYHGLKKLHLRLNKRFQIGPLDGGLNSHWIEHYKFLRNRYWGHPRLKFRDGQLIPKNCVSRRFMPPSAISVAS